jgi:hypothetical protein
MLCGNNSSGGVTDVTLVFVDVIGFYRISFAGKQQQHKSNANGGFVKRHSDKNFVMYSKLAYYRLEK